MPGCCAWGCKNNDRKGFRLFGFPADKERRQLWENKVNRAGWKPKAGSSKLCQVRSFWTLTDKRAIIKCTGTQPV